MITLKHNNGIPIETKTVKTPKSYVATLSVGDDLIFFENHEEYNSYMNLKYPPTEIIEEL